MTRRISTSLGATLLLVALASLSYPAIAQASAPPPRDGQHDFDFNIGVWKTHIRFLHDALTPSAVWLKMEGTVTVRKVWGGKAELEEIEGDSPLGHFEGLTLFTYNPQSHQWNQTFINSSDGALTQPMIGVFKDGRGELVNQETRGGKAVLTRGVWSDITPNAHRFEESLSEDGGKTWEPTFIANLEREQ